jgi:hypothetical protein
VIGRLVPTVVEVDVLRAHRSCTAIRERQCSGVPVVAPGLERLVVPHAARLVVLRAARLVLLRTARLVASPARPATTAVVAACAIAMAVFATAVAACAIAIAIAASGAVYQLVG